MFASREEEILFPRGFGRKRRRELGALEQVFRRTGIPVCLKISSQLQNAWVLTSWKLVCQKLKRLLVVTKNFKTAAKSIARQSLRSQLDSGSRKAAASRVFQRKSAKQTSRSRRDISTKISQ